MKKNKIVLVLASFLSILFLIYIFKMTRDIGRLENSMIESPNIVDVTDQIQTKILVASKEIEKPDWVNAKFNDSSWKKVSIPSYLTVEEKEFKPGNFVYYRILLPQSAFKELSYLKNELSFALQFVQLSKFDIYVNDKLYRTSNPKGPTEFLTILPIDDNKDNTIAIKGYIKDGDSGIYHRSKLMVGKTGELNDLYSESYKSITVISLIYILCKGSILFLFTLIFLVLKVERFFEKSLLYVMFVILEDIMTGDYVTQLLNMNIQVYIYNLANLGINAFLFLFLEDVLGKKYSRQILFSAFAILAVVSYLIAFDILHTSYLFNFDHYLKFWNYVFIIVLLFFIKPILLRERVFAVIVVLALGMTLWSSVFSVNVGFNLKAFANLLIFFGVAYQTFILFRREQEQLLEQEKDVAIGKTAAILAHDVRRPLDQMNLILNKISAGEASREFLQVAKQDVEFAITSVNNQINDIMNFSRTKLVELTPISFYSILGASLQQVLTVKKNVNLTLDYDFKCHQKIQGDESRLASVLTNLIANAVEAIKDIGGKTEGKISLSTYKNKDFLVFKIYNDGPHIPEKILPEIFKPLFTSGKSSGTGLGLASVAKIIHEHGGVVSVENLEQGGVEFKVQLKLSELPDVVSLTSFKSKSSEYSYEVSKVAENSDIKALRIFLLDDDKYVFEYFQFLIKNLSYEVELVYAGDIDKAAEVIKSKRFDLYILDYDLGSNQTGQDFYHEKLSFLKNDVVLHTSRDSSMVQKLDLPLYSKPMTLEVLVELANRSFEKRAKILLVEDSKIITLGWKMYHGNHNLVSVSSPEEALAYLSTKPDINICVLDYYYDGCDMNGEELANEIHSLYPQLEIFISTSAELKGNKFRVINKDEFEIRKLL